VIISADDTASGEPFR